MPLPKYTPPPIQGYVFWSNSSIGVSGDPIREHTLEEVAYSTASYFNITIDDVLVTRFEPDGPPSRSRVATAFAAYVKESHAPKVREKCDYLSIVQQMLSEDDDV